MVGLPLEGHDFLLLYAAHCHIITGDSGGGGGGGSSINVSRKSQATLKPPIYVYNDPPLVPTIR